MDEQFENTIEAFKNRPIHRYLTEKTIDTTSDGDLPQTVFDNLCEKIPGDYEKEYETVMSWNESRQTIYMIWLLEAEVNNGGYHQFYLNSSRKFYTHLPDALKLIGANKFADLTERANTIFEKGNHEIISQSDDGNLLNKLDDEFYELYKTEDLQQMQVAYIRKHKAAFIDK